MCVVQYHDLCCFTMHVMSGNLKSGIMLRHVATLLLNSRIKRNFSKREFGYLGP